MQTNVVFVTYKPNTHFDSAVLRHAAEEADASFPLIQIVARGRAVDEGEKHLFVAGEDRFQLIEPPPGATVPRPAASDTLLSIIGSIDDSADPVKLRIVQSKPAE